MGKSIAYSTNGADKAAYPSAWEWNGSIPFTLYLKQLEMDQRPKFKIRNVEAIKENIGNIL